MSIDRHQAVGAYRRWTPPAFDAPEGTAEHGVSPHDGHVTRPEASRAAPTETPAAPPPASPAPVGQPAFKLPTADEIEAMFEQARKEGHAEGYQEGLREGREQGHADGHAAGFEQGRIEARAEAERLATLVTSMDEALSALDERIADELVTLSVEVARKVIGHTLADQPAVITEVVRTALNHLPQNEIRIHAHPDDAALIREYLGDQLEQGHHRIIESTDISRGGCRLESGSGMVDASIETRWRRVLEGLGRNDTPWDAEALRAAVDGARNGATRPPTLEEEVPSAFDTDADADPETERPTAANAGTQPDAVIDTDLPCDEDEREAP